MGPLTVSQCPTGSNLWLMNKWLPPPNKCSLHFTFSLIRGGESGHWTASAWGDWSRSHTDNMKPVTLYETRLPHSEDIRNFYLQHSSYVRCCGLGMWPVMTPCRILSFKVPGRVKGPVGGHLPWSRQRLNWWSCAVPAQSCPKQAKVVGLVICCLCDSLNGRYQSKDKRMPFLLAPLWSSVCVCERKKEREE